MSASWLGRPRLGSSGSIIGASGPSLSSDEALSSDDEGSGSLSGSGINSQVIWGNPMSSDEEECSRRASLALKHHLSMRPISVGGDDILEELTAQRDELNERIQEVRRRQGLEESMMMRTSHGDAALEGAWRMSKVDEHRFEAAMLPCNICFGAKALLILSPFAFAYKVLGQQQLKAHEQWDHVRRAWNVLQYVLFFVLCLLLLECARMPRIKLYFTVLVMYSLVVIAFFLPAEPLSYPCLNEHCLGWKTMQCAVAQNFFMQVMMFCALFTPWVVPIYHFMRYIWGWIVLAYLASDLWSVNMLASILFLSGVQVIATNRKFYIERGQKNEFMLALKQAEAGDLMFRVLEDMVPHFVVKRMLKDPMSRIADEVSCASVLFVTIVDFDQVARRLPGPAEVLELLNSVFTKFDEACETRGVTKIETFCEEYVCAVGVERDRSVLGHHMRHEVVIVDLIRVALHILELQVQATVEVVFKMGMHTGPVVAGVIGQKLPRFRLFGDTMNTAARMMQKGLPGELQFGEETLERLPPRLARVLTRPRGPVEMKGKGTVSTYLLDHGARARHALDGSASEPYTPAARSNPATTRTLLSEPDSPEGRNSTVRFNSSPSFLAPAHSDDDLSEQNNTPTGPTGSASGSPRQSTWRSPFGVSRSPREHVGSIFRTLQDVGNTITMDHGLPARSARSGFHGSELLREALTEVAPHLSMDKRAKNCWHSVLDGLFPSRDAFYAESQINERAFLNWFHQELVCKKIATRITAQIFCLLIVTIVESGGSDIIRFWKADAVDSLVPVYLLCRLLSVCILLMWRCVVLRNRDWVVRSTRAVQLCILASCWAVSILLFVSYDNALLVDLDMEVALCNRTDDEVLAGQRSYIPLACLPMYTLVTTTYRLRFWYSSSFILLAVALMIYARFFHPAQSTNGATGLVFSPIGMLVFVLTSALHAFESWEEEKSLRTRFKVRVTLDTTRERIQNILNTLMPRKVFEELQVQQLQAGNASVPTICSHRYFRATIAQADLVGFTQMASTRQPGEVVAFVSEIFGRFDKLTDDYEVYKIETVGDAYIAGQAEPPLTKVNSPTIVVVFGLAMVRSVEQWSVEKDEAVSCRVGVHTGACIGGIVGTKMQRYHLFGELMTCLDILESTSPPGRVQVSKACREAAEAEGETADSARLSFEERLERVLTDSKGEVHPLEKVGGPTSLASCR